MEQDYQGAKELIILNDNPSQKLTCNFQGVRVVNLPERISSLGKKYNELVKLAYGTIILPWEDDDISLPHRISQAVERLNGFDWFNPRGSWFQDRSGLHHKHTHGYLVNASAITKEALQRVPFDEISGNQDAIWHGKASALLSSSPHTLNHPREWSYVYRWGMRAHLSGFRDTEAAYRNASTSVAGAYTIHPKWHHDYRELTQCSLRSA